MYKYKRVLHKILIVALVSAFFMASEAISSEGGGSYETLQRDGKLRLILKFYDFTSGRLSYKLAGREDGRRLRARFRELLYHRGRQGRRGR